MRPINIEKRCILVLKLMVLVVFIAELMYIVINPRDLVLIEIILGLY